MSRRGRDVVQGVFGGALYQQGRGFYSALELFAILRGELLLQIEEARVGVANARVLPATGRTLYLRPTHDHSRRLLVSEVPVVDGVFAQDDTILAVRALLRGLEAPVPGRRTTADKWQQRHLYPYPAEAVHYDAVDRRGRVIVERYQFRGAGGLAHKILRSDPDRARLNETRQKFEALLSDSGSAVGKVLSALARHDEAALLGDHRPETPQQVMEAAFDDDVEARSLESVPQDPFSEQGDQSTRWMHLMREGVHRVLTRTNLSDFDRVEGLMHWVPWCIAQHQLAMARRTIGREEDAPLVFDAGHEASQVRRTARRDLGDATVAIKQALFEGATSDGCQELLSGNNAWWKGPRSFYSTTVYAVGALNAHSGHRHYELRPQFLQAVVHALVDEPIELRRFCGEVLGDRLRIACDLASADCIGGVDLDARELDTNGRHLANRLDEVGLLKSFSDSTRMVGVEK